jgi:hypothetical protein
MTEDELMPETITLKLTVYQPGTMAAIPRRSLLNSSGRLFYSSWRLF